MQRYCILLSYLNPQIVGSDPASPGPRKIVPKVRFDSRSQCRQVTISREVFTNETINTTR